MAGVAITFIKWAGLAIAEGFIGNLVYDGVKAIGTSALGNNDDEANEKAKIDRLLTGLNTLQSSTAAMQAALENDIADLHLHSKMDIVQQSFNVINALYEQYLGVLQELQQLVNKSGSQIKDEKYLHLRKRLRGLGNKVTDEVYIAVEHIYTFTSGQGQESLLVLACEQSLRHNPELITHFSRMYLLLQSSLGHQAKAIALLSLALSEPDVGLSDGEDLARNILKKMSSQEAFFRNTVGENIVDVASACLQDKEGHVSVSIEVSDTRRGFCIVPTEAIFPICIKGVNQWNLQLTVPPKNIVLGQENHFRIVQWNKTPLVLRPDFFLISAGQLEESLWKILVLPSKKIHLASASEKCPDMYAQIQGVDLKSEIKIIRTGIGKDCHAFTLKKYEGNLFGTALTAPERLIRNTWIESPNKKFRFWFRDDGHIGVYRWPEQTLFSEVFEQGFPSVSNVQVKSDFRLVGYGEEGQTIWSATQTGSEVTAAVKQLWLQLAPFFPPSVIVTDEGKVQMKIYETIIWST